MSATWWHDAVIYQIYPRSFTDTSGNGVGDIPGVTARLDYLASLGVHGIWLSPFYPSPWADGGYDVADYRDIDPLLGSLADFDTLVSAAHQRGLRVMIDIVPNHTSDRHPWFREALRAAPGSPQRERYVFRDGRGERGEHPPTNWESVFGGPAWTQVGDGQWYLHLFAREQPDLNWDNPEVRAEFRDILRYWSRRGVDGFRIDVAYVMIKDLAEPLRDVVLVPSGSRLDDLSANPDHPYLDRPAVHEIHREWRRVFDEFDPPRIAVGEVWLPSERRVRYTRPDELNQAFSFEFLHSPWEADALRSAIDSTVTHANSVGGLPTWVRSNHDVVRPVSALGLPPGTNLGAWLMSDGTRPRADLALGLRRARASALLTLALPGSAYLYQGEELGLPEVPDLPTNALEDPTWRRSGHTRKGRDGCRVPLPWSTSGPSFGFGPTSPWLPQPSDWGRLSVQAQAGDENSTLELHRTALRARRKFSANPTLTWDERFNTGPVLAFWRGEEVLALVNTGPDPLPLPPGEVLVASAAVTGGTLPGDSAVWLRRQV